MSRNHGHQKTSNSQKTQANGTGVPMKLSWKMGKIHIHSLGRRMDQIPSSEMSQVIATATERIENHVADATSQLTSRIDRLEQSVRQLEQSGAAARPPSPHRAENGWENWPQEILLEVSSQERTHLGQSPNLRQYRALLQDELSRMGNAGKLPRHAPGQRTRCLFCTEPPQHFSVSCPVVIRCDVREDIAQNAGHCRGCLNRHRGRCYPPPSCPHCREAERNGYEPSNSLDLDHHEAICPIVCRRLRITQQLARIAGYLDQ